MTSLLDSQRQLYDALVTLAHTLSDDNLTLSEAISLREEYVRMCDAWLHINTIVTNHVKKCKENTESHIVLLING
jgi:hypothetical protein